MHDVAALFQRLTARYRRRLILKAATGTALGLSCAGLLALRLQQAGMGAARVGLISAGIVALISAWQWRSIRRGSWQRVKMVSDLDRALGLDARLLTAVEFADAPDPPALYPRLLEETAKALPDAQRRLPPVLDRPGAVLALAALLLLLWPQADAHLRASARLQVAMSPPSVMPPETPPIMPPEPPPPQPDQQSGRQDQQQQQRGGQDQQSQGGGSSQDQQQQPQQSGSSGDQSTESQANEGQQRKSGSPESGRQDQRQPSTSGAQQSRGSEESQQQRGGQQQQAGKDSKSGAAEAQGAAQAKSGDKGNEKGASSRESNAAQLAAKGDKGDGDKAGMKAGSSSDAAQQQALKADIQQLLKELSSELKNMQAEMEATQSNSKEPSPLAGGATDPNLYEQSAKLDPASGSRLPIQLEVDTTPTTSPRRGSGTGQASKEASDALPQQEPESASLSDVRTTEQGQARHAIPPDYQPVFERLSPTQQHEPDAQP